MLFSLALWSPPIFLRISKNLASHISMARLSSSTFRFSSSILRVYWSAASCARDSRSWYASVGGFADALVSSSSSDVSLWFSSLSFSMVCLWCAITFWLSSL